MTVREAGVTGQFLLALLGIPDVPEDELRRLAEQADWDHALKLAGSDLLPLCALRLAERRVEMPGWVRERLQQARRMSALMLARRRAETRRALDALAHAGIPVTVLKGFALAHLVYPSPETRMMWDVDLWVHADLEPAVAALEPLGWRVPWWMDTTAGPAGSGGQVGLLLPAAKLHLELHREPGSLVETIPGALDEFWSRRVPVHLGGVPAWILPPEETLIHLSVHLAEHHRFVDAIGRLLDISLVLKTFGSAIDWPSFTGRCAALGISGWVATSLGTASLMLGAPVPAHALAGFQVSDLDRLCAIASTQAWLRPRPGEGPHSVLNAPTAMARGALLRRRLADLFRDGRTGLARPALRPKHVARRLRWTAKVILPGFLRALWRDVAHPADVARLRRLTAENEELVGAMRRHAGARDAT